MNKFNTDNLSLATRNNIQINKIKVILTVIIITPLFKSFFHKRDHSNAIQNFMKLIITASVSKEERNMMMTMTIKKGEEEEKT